MVRAWNEAGVLVTGAASGIGLALSKAMTKRGATVWMTDIDAPGVEKAAKAIGGRTRSATLDVRDAEMQGDLPQPSWRPDVRRYLTSLGGEPYPVDKLAEDAIRGVDRNRALIIAPGRARTAALLYRLFPSLIVRQFDKALARELAHRPRP